MSTKVLDISKWQSVVDFAKVKSTGITGVICRAAYGTSIDTKFISHMGEANAVGIIAGAYAFATYHYTATDSNAVTMAVAQAKAFIAILQKTTVTGAVALDLELEKGKTTALSKSTMTTAANAYMSVLADAGYTPYLYCSIAWLYDRMIPTSVNYPLWIAYYNSCSDTSNVFPATKYGNYMTALKDKIALWQYSSTATPSDYGIVSNGLDINWAYRDISTNKFYNVSFTGITFKDPECITLKKILSSININQTTGEVVEVPEGKGYLDIVSTPVGDRYSLTVNSISTKVEVKAMVSYIGKLGYTDHTVTEV